jgi:low temperature requirement protein LtrA
LLIAEPHDRQLGMGLAIVLGGPALFLLGESLFQWMTTGRANTKRMTAAGLIVGLVPVAPHVPALVLAVVVTGLLSTLALWELRASALLGWASRQRVVAV